MDYSTLSPEDLVLACAQTGDAAAWEEFVRRFQRLIATVALRVARRWGESSPQLVDDLVQETYLKLCADDCRLLRSFQPQHPDAFYGFLKVVTANLVHDHFKATQSAKRGADLLASEGLPPEPLADGKQAGSETAIERQVFLNQVDECLRRAEAGPDQRRNCVIFWLYYRQGLTAAAIAALPSIGLTTKGVESTLLRLTRLIRSELNARRSRGSGSAVGDTKGIRPPDPF